MVDSVTGWEGVAVGKPATHEADERPEELIVYLESDQLVKERSQPVARARLSVRRRRMLWAVRVFGFALSAMVVYTFVSQLAA
jgi:hypothetical protein